MLPLDPEPSLELELLRGTQVLRAQVVPDLPICTHVSAAVQLHGWSESVQSSASLLVAELGTLEVAADGVQTVDSAAEVTADELDIVFVGVVLLRQVLQL